MLSYGRGLRKRVRSGGANGKRHSRTSSMAATAVIVEVGDGGSDAWRNEALGRGVLCMIHRLWWRGLIEEGTEKTRLEYGVNGRRTLSAVPVFEI